MKVVDVVEAGVDPRVYTRVHDFWIPSVLAATYRIIVERCSHMVKECIVDIKTLRYISKNLLEVADNLSRAGDDPIDAGVLKGWETTIRSSFGLGFPMKWLDETLIMVSIWPLRAPLRTDFQIGKGFDRSCQRNFRKEGGAEQDRASFDTATNASQQAEITRNEVRVELDKKRQELARFHSI